MKDIKAKLQKVWDNNKLYLGLAIRTGVAVAFCVFVTKGLSLESPFYASLAAFITMEIDHKESFYKGVLRLLGTVLGAVIAIIMLKIGFNNYLAVGTGVALIIFISHFFSAKTLKNVACIVFVAIMYNIHPEISPLEYTMYRFFDTLIGVTIATSIAYLSKIRVKPFIVKYFKR